MVLILKIVFFALIPRFFDGKIGKFVKLEILENIKKNEFIFKKTLLHLFKEPSLQKRQVEKMPVVAGCLVSNIELKGASFRF